MAVATSENDHLTNPQSDSVHFSSVHSSDSDSDDSSIPNVDEIVDQMGFWSQILTTDKEEHSIVSRIS